MKGNLTQLEPQMLACWESEGTYRTLLREERDGAAASSSTTARRTRTATCTPATR